MLGYCSIGSDTRPSTPNMTTRMEITVESTGRVINLSNFICFRFITTYQFVTTAFFYFPNAFFSFLMSP